MMMITWWRTHQLLKSDDENKNAKLAGKHGVQAYKEELIVMVGVKRALAANQKEEKMTCFYKMRTVEEEK